MALYCLRALKNDIEGKKKMFDIVLRGKVKFNFSIHKGVENGAIGCLFWVLIHVLSGPVDGGIYFRPRIILRTILGQFLVFFTFIFRNVPGIVPDCTRTCGFRRNSSSLDRGLGIQLFVLLNS